MTHQCLQRNFRTFLSLFCFGTLTSSCFDSCRESDINSWQQQRATELTTLQEHHERELGAMADRLRREQSAAAEAAREAERRVQHAQAQQQHAETMAHERQTQSRSAVANEVQSRVDGSVPGVGLFRSRSRVQSFVLSHVCMYIHCIHEGNV